MQMVMSDFNYQFESPDSKVRPTIRCYTVLAIFDGIVEYIEHQLTYTRTAPHVHDPRKARGWARRQVPAGSHRPNQGLVARRGC